MATETESQAQTTGTGEDNQLLGLESELTEGAESTETESTDSPETTETEAEETESTEGEEEAETETEGEETADEEEESDDNWLPSEQEKQFPLEVLADYAKRRGYKWTAEQIAENADLQKLLKDKLNSDIYIKEKLEAEGTEEGEGEFDGNQFEEEPIAEAVAAVTTQADPAKAYDERITQIVSSNLDQGRVAELGKGILEAMGVDTDTAKLEKYLSNPKLSPEQRTEAQGALALAKNAGKIGQVIATGGVDLLMTAMPQLLPEMIESIFPGTRARYEAGVYASAWQNVVNTPGKDGKPIYQNLPAYGSKEFGQMARKAERQLGLPQDGLLNLVIKDPRTGQPLPLEQQAAAKYKMIARASSGQRVTPAAVKQAVETGKRQATETAQRRAAGRAMGSGLTSKGLNNQGEEDEILSALKNQIDSSNETWDTPMKKR